MSLALGLIAAAGAAGALSAAEGTTCAVSGQEHMLLQAWNSKSSSERAGSGGDATRTNEESISLRTASSSMYGGQEHDEQSWYASQFACPPQNYRSQAYAVPLASPDFFEPVFASHPPGSDAVEVAIIVVHGANRVEEGYFREMVRIVDEHKSSEHTLVVAPAWGEKPCSAADWSGGTSNQVRGDAQAPMWALVDRPFAASEARSWTLGGGSVQGAHSFEVLDSVVEWVEVNYPRLRRLVVTGFSFGGQYVQRWAAFSPEGANGVTRSRGLPLRIIAGGPSAILYLNEERPDPACVPDEDQGANWSCSDFSIPSPERDCDSLWNKYSIGLDGLHDGASSEGDLRHDVNQYLRKSMDTASSSKLSKQIRDRWATKDIRFLFGSGDTRHCTTSMCSDLCEAMLTGKSRLQRGLNFMGYLEHLFPGSQPVWGIYDGGHSCILAFESHHFTAWALEDSLADGEIDGEDGDKADGESDEGQEQGCTSEEGDPFASGELVECCAGLVTTLGLHGKGYMHYVCKPDSP